MSRNGPRLESTLSRILTTPGGAGGGLRILDLLFALVLTIVLGLLLIPWIYWYTNDRLFDDKFDSLETQILETEIAVNNTLALFQLLSEKGVPSGYAGLNGAGRVPFSQGGGFGVGSVPSLIPFLGAGTSFVGPVSPGIYTRINNFVYEAHRLDITLVSTSAIWSFSKTNLPFTPGPETMGFVIGIGVTSRANRYQGIVADGGSVVSVFGGASSPVDPVGYTVQLVFVYEAP